ncbi:hypothetical protein [Massilia sp. Mn16-1_5]|uniref:hypothetical protein n=1 Tax=Massilia sp. Mn16-1_5 TaxID=2079199 RepID=UPI00109E5577|nr:hypothetical protein [Massilia sp. Mn16-1_5]
MSIAVSALAPYASFVVAYSTVAAPDYKLLQRNLKAVLSGLNGQIKISSLATPTYAGITSIYAFHAKEKRPASWSGSNTIEDQLNHLVAYFAYDRFALIYVSDAELKSEVYDALYDGRIKNWQPADERTLVNSYITGSTLRTLWLGGTHRNVTVRPNSKIISGPDLRDAIDPFGDSTFVAGAVRSSKAGVSLKRSGLWFRPSKNWGDCCDVAKAVLDVLVATQASLSTLSSTVHHGLATRVFDFTGVGPAYAVEWEEPDTLKGKHRARKLAGLKDRFEIELGTASVANKDVPILITDTTSGATCSLILQPDFVAGRLVLTFSGSCPKAFAELVATVTSDPELIKVYYETWHTLAHASLSLAIVQDRPFNLEFCDFAPGTAYCVDMEKPPGASVPIANICSVADLSLFKWVFKDGLAQLGLAQPATGQCWLYCDDGSGEIADFIHIELPTAAGIAVPRITLIHVKGANSDKASRKISVGAYEVVTAQAMKNLRRMSSASIIPDLATSIGKHGGMRVWDQPWSAGLVSTAATGTAMLAALRTITADCEYQVIVVQPHVLKSKYQTPSGHATGPAAIQLRSLLFGAQLAAQAVGAKFRVVSDMR